MAAFRKTKKSVLYCWVILLSLALLCAQEVKLHVHSLEHDHGHPTHHIDLHQEQTNNHNHLSIAHLSSDVSHNDHHDEVISEIDACPDCLLVKISGKVPFMALLAIIFMLVLFGLYRHAYNRRYDDDVIPPWRFLLLPPLRAPPC